MRSKATLVGALCLVTATVWFGVSEAQTAPAAAPASTASAIRWDNPGVDVRGQAILTPRAVVELRDAAGSVVRREVIDIPPAEATTTFALGAFLAGVPDGPYTAQVRLVSASGVVSAPAETPVEVASGQPASPVNIRVIVNVNLSVGGP